VGHIGAGPRREIAVSWVLAVAALIPVMRALVGGGVNVCFADLSTWEMHFFTAFNPVAASAAHGSLIATGRAAPLPL
jgi:hypothetical protein